MFEGGDGTGGTADHSLEVTVNGDVTGTIFALDAGFEETTGVATGAGGLIALAGHTQLLIQPANTISPSHPTVALYTVDGAFLWSARIALGDGWGRAGGVAIGASGSVYAIAEVGDTADYKDNRTILTKFYPDGTFAWSTISREGLDNVGGPGIALDENENVFVSGALPGEEDGIHTSAVVLTKLDSEGHFEWRKTWEKERSFGTDVGVDAQGDIYVSACIQGPFDEIRGSSLMTPLLIKFDSSGDVLWDSRWSDDEIDTLAWNIHVDADGTSWVSGVDSPRSEGAGQAPEPVFVTKHDAGGEMLWTQDAGLPARMGEYTTSVAVAPSGEVLVATTKEDEDDYLKSLTTTAWLSPEGTPLQGETWDAQAETTYSTGVVFDSFGHGIVAGYMRIAGDDNETTTGPYFLRYPSHN
jgi:hypothetical protein